MSPERKAKMSAAAKQRRENEDRLLAASNNVLSEDGQKDRHNANVKQTNRKRKVIAKKSQQGNR